MEKAKSFMQLSSFDKTERQRVAPFRNQLLKWIGNKQRFAHEIVSFFPADFETYFEPFLGSGAVLSTLAPRKAIASDVFEPLVKIWQTLSHNPDALKQWYKERWQSVTKGDKITEYEKIKASYNARPNPADLLFLCRSCYGGVMRFRQSDGYISTPCGVHSPITPEAFSLRVDQWHRRLKGAEFLRLDYREAMEMARPGDLIYCDPPYSHSQTILYGAQSFDIENLFHSIGVCKARGVRVALSIDGTKRSGNLVCDVAIPDGIFEREARVNCGRSMLRRFQMGGQTLESEIVADRLLLTY